MFVCRLERRFVWNVVFNVMTFYGLDYNDSSETLSATNDGPGAVTLHAIEARSRPKLIGKLTHMLLIPLKDFPKRLDLTAFYDNISK